MSTSIEQTSDDTLKKKIFLSLDKILPLPQVLMKVQNLLLNTNSSFNELSSIIETDKEITLKVLQVANSAYYGLRSQVRSVHQACIMLGYSVIGEIIMAAGTSNLFSKPLKGYNLKEKGLWQHSLAVALGSRIIANTKQPKAANEAFLSGLFHDAGKLVLDKYIIERSTEFEEFLENGQNTFLKAEKQILGLDHSEIALELGKRWKFPKPLINAMGYHHTSPNGQTNELASILNTADTLVKISDSGNAKDSKSSQIDEKKLEFLSLSEEKVSSIINEVNESVNKMTEELFCAA